MEGGLSEAGSDPPIVLMLVDFTPQGIYLPELDLWLDGTSHVAVTWMSHGHSDHAWGYHERVIGTPQTLAAYAIRWSGGGAGLTQFQPVQFGEPFSYNGARLTAYPASHILGASQLLIELRGERLVYTGDIKLRPPLCGETTVPVPCDRLIIESTFGLPVYRTLSREEARDRIVAFARECLADGVSPIFQGYALGRGQEIAHVLCQAGIPTSVHGAIAKFIPLYEENGYGFPGWTPYDSRDTKGKALVVVPSFRATLEASGRAVRVAYVSGWACLDNARARSGAEELIPYSDHADFYELLELVERTGAREVDVVHGYTLPFARILEQRGLVARAPHHLAGREEDLDA